MSDVVATAKKTSTSTKAGRGPALEAPPTAASQPVLRKRKARATQPAPVAPASNRDVELAAILGIKDSDMIHRISADVMSLASGDEGTRQDLLEGAMLVVRSMAPKNMMEAMLVIQMAAVHRATVHHAAALNRSNTALEIELSQNGLSKLARTFTMQVEALQRLQGGGTRTIRIERVNVSNGGQAIIGNIGRGVPEK
jgi:hypothetical protein